MLFAMALGGLTGKRMQARVNEDAKAQANAVQGSLLGLLALLLGFELLPICWTGSGVN